MYKTRGIVSLYEWSWWSCSTQVERDVTQSVYCNIMLILRRSNCMYTAYGIVTLYEWSWWSCSTQVEQTLETCRGL
jgi:hypothetical protein